MTRPPVPSGIVEYFLPNNLTLAEAYQATGSAAPSSASATLVYRPTVLAQANVRFLNRKYNLDYELVRAVRVINPDRRGTVRWEDHLFEPLDPRRLDNRPAPQARFAPLEAPFSDARVLTAMAKDFADWAFRSAQVSVHVNEQLKQYAGPDISDGEFRQQCAEAARSGLEAETDKIAATFDKKLAALQTKLRKEERELEEDQTELSQRKMEELGTHAENIFGLFGGRRSSRKISSSLSKRRMTAQAKADVEESQDTIEELKTQIAALEQEKAKAVEDARDRWGEVASQVDQIKVQALKKDVLVELFGVAWMPFYLVEGEELPAYAAQ
jgi:hypothetical protein